MPENMRAIGQIKQVQVQPESLSIEQGQESYYDPTPLLVVEQVRLFPGGIVGVTTTGKHVMDVHHIDHLDSRNSRGSNGVSLGFSSHYCSMRARFGERLVDGCAGENILIEAAEIVTLPEIEHGLAIQSAATGEFVYLKHLKIARPCMEFSQFAANEGRPLPAAELKATLQFLDNGLRGFYATVANDEGKIAIRAGDTVYRLVE